MASYSGRVLCRITDYRSFSQRKDFPVQELLCLKREDVHGAGMQASEYDHLFSLHYGVAIENGQQLLDLHGCLVHVPATSDTAANEKGRHSKMNVNKCSYYQSINIPGYIERARRMRTTQERRNASINWAYIWYTILHLPASGQYGKDIWAGLMHLQSLSDEHGTNVYFHHLCAVACEYLAGRPLPRNGAVHDTSGKTPYQTSHMW